MHFLLPNKGLLFTSTFNNAVLSVYLMCNGNHASQNILFSCCQEKLVTIWLHLK